MEGFLRDQSGRATRVSGSAAGTYKPIAHASSVTEGHIGGAVYILDTEDSAGSTSDTNAFDEAPRPITPSTFRDVDAGRDSEEIPPVCTFDPIERIPEQRRAGQFGDSDVRGDPSDHWSEAVSPSGTHDAPASRLDYGDF